MDSKTKPIDMDPHGLFGFEDGEEETYGVRKVANDRNKKPR